MATMFGRVSWSTVATTTRAATLPTLLAAHPVASTSQRPLSTTAVALGKSRPGEGRMAKLRAKRAANKAKLLFRSTPSGQDLKSAPLMPFTEALRLFQAVEVARPFAAYEVTIRAKVPSNEINALRGRMALPNDVRTKPERILVLAEGDTEVSAYVQAMLDENPSLKKTLYVEGATAIADLVEGKGAATRFRFTKLICSQPLLAPLSRQLARTYGPKGLMPSAKRGTVVKTATEVHDAIRNAQGSLEWRGDRHAIVRCAIARANFTDEEIRRNFTAFLNGLYDALKKGFSDAKDKAGLVEPSSELIKLSPGQKKAILAKLTSLHISTTQGPSVQVAVEDLLSA